jgi:drug/metabolite transporter (DMT)-like permease
MSAVASGALATTMVGASVPVTGLLAGYPVLSGQAIRYGIGAVVMYAWLRRGGGRLPRPGPKDLVGLAGMVGGGMLGFSAAVLEAQRYAQPGFVAAMIGGAPLVLVLVPPALRGRRPGMLALVGAATVTIGVVVLSGGGSWHGPGLALSALALVGEVMFTVSGVGVIRRLGVLETCVLSCGIAAASGAVLSTAFLGAAAWPMPSVVQLVALVALGAVLTAVGFRAWYSSVSVLGADRAGVLIGLIPVSGLVASVLLGAQPVTVSGVGGTLLVGIGCAVGLRPRGR